MRSSDVRREGLRATIQDGNFYNQFRTESGEVLVVPSLQLLRDSETRWSSTFLMIQRYLKLYPAVLHYSIRNPSASIPVISHKQYEVLQDICSVLSVLHNAQELLSAERTPTISLALPVYETLIQSLYELRHTFPELRYAIGSGASKLEKYVVKAHDVPVYALAMLLNPCFKLDWMRQHWSEAEVQNAIREIKAQMLYFRQEQLRAGSVGAGSKSGAYTPAEAAARAQGSGYTRLLTKGASITRASSAHHSSSARVLVPETSSEAAAAPSHDPALDVEAEWARWVAEKACKIEDLGKIDLVKHWMVREIDFPSLHRVAMNILPVQASAVSSERAFSSSKMTCTRERNNI